MAADTDTDPRRVPEAALLVGVVLSLSFATFVLVTDFENLLRSPDYLFVCLAITAGTLYGFGGYAVYHGDLRWALPPRVVVAVAGVLAAATLVVGVLLAAPVQGVAVAALVVLPPVAYAVTVERDLRPSRRWTLGVAVACGVAIDLLGLLTGRVLLGAVTALTVALAGVAYDLRYGRRSLGDRAVGGGAVAAAVVVGGVGLLRAVPVGETLLAVSAVAIGGAITFNLDRQRGRGRRGR